MKKTLVIALTLIFLFPIFIKATSYGNAESLSKRYINNFLNPDRYINVNKGNLISKTEVEKTIVRNNLTVSSYMYNGIKFWAKDKYVIGEKIDRNENADVKTKVTEIVLHNTKVSGSGRYNNPWIFIDSHKVTVKSNGNGLIDDEVSSTKGVDSFGSASFTITPSSGYKYLSNTCGVNASMSGNTLTISNVEKDIECSVSFEASKYSNTLPVPSQKVHIALTNTDVVYKFDQPAPEPQNFYSRYLNGYYADDKLTTRLGKLSKVPARKGWIFKGYYVNGKQLINANGYFETTYSLLKDNNQTEKITFEIEPQKFDITFNKQNGEGGTDKVEHWPYEHDMPLIVIPKRVGYLFDGYFSSPKGGGEKYYNANGKASRIFNPDKLENLTLYAKWVACPKGYYCPGDNAKYACPSGYTTESTASYKCTQCRYWNSCYNRRCYSCRVCHTTCFTFDAGWNSNCSPVCYDGDCCDACVGKWIYVESESSCKVNVKNYTVNLDKQGGSGGTSSYSLTYHNSTPSTLIDNDVNVTTISIPTRAGYVFDGYYTKPNGSGTKIITVNTKYKASYNPSSTSYTQAQINDLIESMTGIIIHEDVKGAGAPLSGNTLTIYAKWTPCPAGGYCPGDNKVYQCPAGTYQDETGKPNCKNCVAGSYSNVGSNKCIACLNGKTSNAKSSSCNINCTNTDNVQEWIKAEWKNNNTVTNICTIKTCKNGYEIQNNKCVRKKIKCPAGKYYRGSDHTCQDCPAGAYCPGDEFVINDNNQGINYCPAGTYNSSTGKSSQSACTSCAVGSYSNAGATACIACQPDGDGLHGTTTGPGQSSCNANCSMGINKTDYEHHWGFWDTAVWNANNNTTSKICSFSCKYDDWIETVVDGRHYCALGSGGGNEGGGDWCSQCGANMDQYCNDWSNC